AASGGTAVPTRSASRSPATRASSPVSPTRRSSSSSAAPSARSLIESRPLMSHPLAGHATVDASARRIGHYRWLEERLLRILGGWIALTPELPVKLLFGRHVWDCAQHADLWGRRLPELRARPGGEPPSEGFAHLTALIERLQDRHESIARVVAAYRVLKPHLVAAYRAHLAEANPIYEPPTRRILERCLGEERRHVAAGAVVLGRLRAVRPGLAEEWEQRWLDELARVEGLAGA